VAGLRIVNTFPLPDDAIAVLRALPGVTLTTVSQDELAATDLSGVDALFGELPDRDPARAPDLRWIVRAGAGVEDVDLAGLAARGVTLTNASGLHASSMGEYCLAALLFGFQRLPARLAAQVRHEWQRDAGAVTPLRDRTLAILGYGSIGREVARLVAAFGMRVLAVKLRPEQRQDDGYQVPRLGDPDGTIPERIVGLDAVTDVLREADAVVIALPLTDRTRGLIDAATLAVMKPTAWLVNIGRGPMIDEVALVDALRGGRLGGAYLDVFDEEPLPPDHPYWDTPDLYVSPHIAGVNCYARYWTDMGRLLEINARHLLAGEPMVNAVDTTRAY
jgi:phosphoglycerate dehydrogenase-like enzyme